jgi:hypothetical protein
MVYCLEWLRYGWFSICLFMAFDSTCCIVTSSLLCELSHTLSLYAYLKCEIALVLTWSCSMYYNCSILYLASCAAWFVHLLWSAPVRLYLLLVWLDLFAALCHNALVMTHVCSIMVFISSIDVTFSWLVSTLFWDQLLWWSTFFLSWMVSGFCLWSLIIILALVAFVPMSYVFWLALLFEWPMLVLSFV